MHARIQKRLALATVGVLVVLGILFVQWPERWHASLPVSESPVAKDAFDAIVRGVPPDRTDDIARVAAANADVGPALLAAVEGRVCNALGMPLAGVQVTGRPIVGPNEVSAAPATSTDAGGRFVIMLAAEATSELAFSCSGYRPCRAMARAPTSGFDVVLERSPTLRGRVVLGDGTPVGGALARWSNPHTALGVGATTTTGIDGRFVFCDLPWAIDLEVIAADTLPVHQWVQVQWGMQELVVTVDQGRQATGTVVDAQTGAGLAGASISLWYYGSTYTAEGRRGGAAQHAETVKAQEDGSFLLTKLPSVSDKRRADAWLWVTAQGRAPHWKIVPLAERAEELRVALYPAGGVRGRVVDGSGVPVRGQRVHAEAQAQPLCDAGPNQAFRRQDGGYSVLWQTRRPEAVAPFHTEREAFTDAEGDYFIDRVPCPPDGGEVTVALCDGQSRVDVVVRPGEVAIATDLVRPEGLFRRCHGVARDDSARPVAGATIEVGTARTVADVLGRFDFEVPSVPDTREVRATAIGYVPFRGVVTEGDDGGVTITLARGLRLAVLVFDSNQRPVPDASVQAFPEDGLVDFANGAPRPIAISRGRSDENGTVLLEGVPNTCDVLIECSSRNAPMHRKIMRAVTVGAGIIRVVVEDLDLSAGASSLSVRVVDGRVNAEYLGAVLVEVRSEREIWRQLAPGPVIRLDGLSRGELEVSVVAEGLGARSERVELLQDQRIDVRLGEGIAIAGTVTCAAGGLARPVQLHAREIATKRLSATRTDAAGRFVFAGMEPGDYLLSVDPFESDDFAQFPLRVPQSHASLVPARVRVAAGLEPAPVIVSVVPVAPLRVVVTPDTVPQTAETVWAWAQGLEFTVADDQGDSLYTGGPSGIMTAAAELLLRLPEGRYTVRVHRRGEALGERTLTTGESWRLHAP